VLALAAIKRLRFRQAAGLLPSTDKEWFLWIIWAPLIVIWNVLPALVLRARQPWVTLPEIALTNSAIAALRWAAALTGIFWYGCSLICWVRMGRNWSVAILPGAKRELVRSGPFAIVRHPIYALSIALVACSAIVMPIPAMLLLACVHATLMHVKARGEETYLFITHGQAYADYCRATGRFFPRLNQDNG
jgi:protein-S-isoprenylcysteine O-methyltransferase Ste14